MMTNRFFSIIILFILLSSALKSQNNNSDSLLVLEDSLTTIQNHDQIVKFENNIDINRLIISLDTSNIDNFSPDSISIKNNLNKANSDDSVLIFIRDSTYFDEPDTIHYVIQNLNNLIQNETIPVNDTIKQAITKLINYTRNREIEPVINYLHSKLKKQDLLVHSSDSSLKLFNDSISNAVDFLLKSIPEDSIKLSFINLNSDSILFKSAESDVDSVHLNLFDNRGEYAVLWIKKTDLNVFDIYLEDGVYLEKAKVRKVVGQTLDVNFNMPKLKEVRKVNINVALWDFEGLADLRFNQGYISPSWAEGGENSLSVLSILKYSADYSYGKKRNLDTDIEYRLGYLKAGENDFQKNDDKFEINAKYGMQAISNWYYSGLLNFKTQFFKGKEIVNDSTINTVSNILSPAYLVFSLGMDYKPNNKLTILFSPLTSKLTIVADTVNYDQTRFGVGQDEFIRKEVGAYIKAISKLKFRDNIELENKINFFTNYTNKPQNIDVDWEVNLNVKLTDYIKMSVNAHFIYDDDVTFTDKDGRERGARAQFKEMFGIGFAYNF